MTGETTAAAAAKINLYLHVVGRRPDGYHLLDSLMAFAAVHDTVVAAAADDLSLAVDGPFADALAGEGDNLVLRAARRLAEAAGVPARARLRLVKRLPVASGIGGGSADAAACLRALARLWRVDLPPAELDRIALELGADVPVCLHGRAAFAGGIGEDLAPVPDLPEAPLVLVNPGVAVSTPDVFRARTGGFSEPARFADPVPTAADLAALLAGRGNDLADPALSVAPAVGEVLSALSATPGCLLARMSGSGATCFGLYATDEEAQAAATAIAAARPGWWCVATRLLSRAPDDDSADRRAA